MKVITVKTLSEIILKLQWLKCNLSVTFLFQKITKVNMKKIIGQTSDICSHETANNNDTQQATLAHFYFYFQHFNYFHLSILHIKYNFS